MHRTLAAGVGLVVLGGSAFFAFSEINLGQNNGPLAPDRGASGIAASDIPSFLDPAEFSKTLCGKQGKDRGGFFKPEFHSLLSSVAHAAPAEEPEVPLWDGLGDTGYAITNRDPRAQAYFNQGLRLAYAFNHWEAARAFRQARTIDPACAMCYWGEALVLGPNINLPMQDSAVAPAFAAISQAVALKEYASPKEQALIGALQKRYVADPPADRTALDKAYADAMAVVYDAYPDDQDIAALYAESRMTMTPWDYWERDFITPKPHIKPAIAAIEKVLARNPDHPGAVHFYIHLMEPSKTPEKAEPYADRLATLMPSAGHLVHMPGHIYFRVGRYLDSLKTNLAAVKADEAYLARVEGSDMYRYGYYPHNVHFVLVSAQMAGDEKTALDFARKLDQLIPMEAATQAAWVQPIKVAPWFAYLQFGSDEDVLSIPAPPDGVPYIEAMWRYVQGSVHARKGHKDQALAEAAAIRSLWQDDKIAEMAEGGVPAADILEIAALVIEARLDRQAGDLDAAIRKLETATDLQNGLIYSEPPFWYYPIDQTLGAFLLQADRPEQAADAFRDSLVLHPNNAWSLYGLMKAQRASGDPAAYATEKLYRQATSNPDDLDLGRY